MAGPVLLGAGLLLLLMGGRGLEVGGSMFPFALGLIFLYVSRQAKSPGQELGFRIPGCILTGLGAGILLGGPWAAVGLGLGFAALWYADRRQWWWLIPAAAVGLGGLDGLRYSSGLFNVNSLVPIALILFGAYLVRERRLLARR
jgi:hypothetical protein